ncbi:MAG: hypothetical protein BJ554DRAFT_7883 [Olpidium bornovanus]|uniref:Uncharacterized protein n=1 Tax=Olpidium bornovanus TaxID=278681 RepID=A0A8H7ZVV0_9FUNG|nr:MAG: hypothetical protein BJ554DRAFT_7883 [Olpidium bornovanus]
MPWRSGLRRGRWAVIRTAPLTDFCDVGQFLACRRCPTSVNVLRFRGEPVCLIGVLWSICVCLTVPGRCVVATHVLS